MHELFEEQVRRDPDAVALVSGSVRLTYGELNARVNRVAHLLRDEYGVGADTLVGLCVERSPELVVGLLGVLKAGGAYVPLDPEYPAERIAFMLEDTSAPVVLTQQHLAARLPDKDSPAVRVLVEDASEGRKPIADPSPACGSSDLAYVIYTSGSTGRPKGVMVEHRSVVNYLEGLMEAALPAGSISSLLHNSIGFDFTVPIIYIPLFSGGTLHLAAPRFPNEELVSLIQTPGLDMFRLTPSHIDVLTATIDGELELHGPRMFLIGGEKLRKHQLASLRRMFPDSDVYNHYGCTETAAGCCVMPLSLNAGFHEEEYGSHDALPVGSPLPNSHLIVSQQDAGRQNGRVGELLVGGSNLARGYLRTSDEIADRFVTLGASERRYYRTGDLVSIDDHGRLVVLGRSDDQAKVRGHRVEPAEVEVHLLALSEVRTAVVLPAGSALTAFVVSVPGTVLDPGYLRRSLSMTLPDFMLPQHFVALEEIPLMSNGKIDRSMLQRIAADVASSQDSLQQGPETPEGGVSTNGTVSIVESACRACERILDLPTVSTSDNFLALGGDSITAIRMTMELRELGLSVASRDVLDAENLFELVWAAGGANHSNFE